MKDEYIIINKTAIQKRIKELKFQREREPDNYTQSYLDGKLNILKEILSKSTTLIPEIEKAFDAGFKTKQQGILMKRIEYTQQKQDYISNLKLDI